MLRVVNGISYLEEYTRQILHAHQIGDTLSCTLLCSFLESSKQTVELLFIFILGIEILVKMGYDSSLNPFLGMSLVPVTINICIKQVMFLLSF